MILNPNFYIEQFARTAPQKNQVLKERYLEDLCMAGFR